MDAVCAKNDPKRYGRNHDVPLFYSRSDRLTWNRQNLPFGADFADLPANLSKNYTYTEPITGRRYRLSDLTANKPGGDTDYDWRGMRPYKGRHWAFSRANMEKMDVEGRIVYRRTGMPVYKRYIDEMPGVPLQDIWIDIRLSTASKERLGWDTQKPVALLERIIEASSNPGDIVLDPFCGCGTALVAAQKLDRRWIGIDVTYLSIAVVKARLKDSFGLADIEVIGQPTEVEGARAMLVGTGLEGQYQFQWWALDLIGAQPQGGTQKKGADRGIDGVISFSTGPRGEVGRALVSVKSGSVNSSMVRDLKGVLEREKAEIGLFVTLEEPSAPMRLEATTAGVYHSELSGRDYPRIQLITIQELLEEHRRPDLPILVLPTYQRAERVETKAAEQSELFG